MIQAGLEAPNPLVLLRQAKNLTSKHKETLINGVPNGIPDVGGSSVVTELHGAEEEIARGNAFITEVDQHIPGKNASTYEGQVYMTTSEVHATITLLFEKDGEVLDLVYNSRPSSSRPSST